MNAAVSLIIWFFCSFLTVAVFFAMLLFTIILFPFDKKRKVVHAQAFWWSDAIIALNPFWKLTVSGLEHIDRHKAYVITANHQSMADIIVLYKTRMQFKWVAKASLFKIPFIGWNLSLAKHIKLFRGHFSSIKKTQQESREWLRKGISVLFFPEGTRSETGEIKQFKNGAFKLAIKEQAPILPISITGTMDAIPKGSWIFARTVSCQLKVHPAVETTGMTMKDLEQIKETVYTRLATV